MKLVKIVIVGWALFLGGFGAWGWSSSGASTSAIVSAFACCMMLNASHQLRDAQEHGRKHSAAIWIGALVLFGGWSGYSAHHAAMLSRADLGGLESFWLLAFFTISALVDPQLMWAVNDTEKGATADPKQSGVRLATSDGAVVASAVGAVGSVVNPSSATTPSSINVVRMTEPSSLVTTDVGYADARAHALALKAENPHMSVTGIALRVNRPRTTVGEWLRA